MLLAALFLALSLFALPGSFAQQPVLPTASIAFIHEDSGRLEPEAVVFNLRLLNPRDPARQTPVTRFVAPGTVVLNPDWSPDRRRIAFSSDLNALGSLESQSVFVVNADGKGLRQVTGYGLLEPLRGATGTVTGRVVVAPVAGAGAGTLKRAVIIAQGTQELATTAADGTFTLRGVPVGAVWVKAQAEVSYASPTGGPEFAAGGAQIRVRAGQTTDVGTINLEPIDAKSIQPAWSPDGSRLLVTTESGKWSVLAGPEANAPGWQPLSRQQLGVWEVDGVALRQIQLPSQTPLSLSGADWARTHGRLVCSATTVGGGSSLVAILNADGSGAHTIYQSPTTATTFSQVGQCRWSPDGRRIAFIIYVATLDGSAAWADVHVINADGTGNQRVVGNSIGNLVSSISWSPDGTFLAFDVQEVQGGTLRKSDIFVVPAAGGAPIRLTSDGRSGQPAW
jgi:dipeptidyl aminopeptidase/acylaminoacyl peptidase